MDNDKPINYNSFKEKADKLGLATHNKFSNILEATLSTIDLHSPLSLP